MTHTNSPPKTWDRESRAGECSKAVPYREQSTWFPLMSVVLLFRPWWPPGLLMAPWASPVMCRDSWPPTVRSMQVTLSPPYLTATSPGVCRLSLSALLWALIRGLSKPLSTFFQHFEEWGWAYWSFQELPLVRLASQSTLDVELLSKAALCKSNHRVPLPRNHQTHWLLFLPQICPRKYGIGSGSESSLPFKRHYRYIQLELLRPFSFQQVLFPA